MSTDGPAARPTLTVGNLDGSITALCLAFDDLAQARVTIRETFGHYLDARNFPEGNPDANPEEERLQYWDIDTKVSEDNEHVAWELASPADSNGLQIPARIIHTMCEWSLRNEYRGADCGYTGPPVTDAYGKPTDDPAKDVCLGCLSDCKARFGDNNPLPFGGFPRCRPSEELSMRKHILKSIRAHAARDYPREACGLVVQIGRRHVYVPCANLALDPKEQFQLDPQDYAQAEDLGTIIGIVHSHPDETSRASDHDRASCEVSGLPWHILSWPEGDLNTIVPTGVPTPLIGRPFVHGVWDCYAIVRDWHLQERGIELPNYERTDEWWTRGENLYAKHYVAAGFEPVTGPCSRAT